MDKVTSSKPFMKWGGRIERERLGGIEDRGGKIREYYIRSKST